MKRLGVFQLPLDWMVVHRRSLPHNLLGFPQQITGTHLYTWVETGTVRVKCLAQEHNTMSPARARTRTARSGDERTNHEATAPCLHSVISVAVEGSLTCRFSKKFAKAQRPSLLAATVLSDFDIHSEEERFSITGAEFIAGRSVARIS